MLVRPSRERNRPAAVPAPLPSTSSLSSSLSSSTRLLGRHREGIPGEGTVSSSPPAIQQAPGGIKSQCATPPPPPPPFSIVVASIVLVVAATVAVVDVVVSVVTVVAAAVIIHRRRRCRRSIIAIFSPAKKRDGGGIHRAVVRSPAVIVARHAEARPRHQEPASTLAAYAAVLHFLPPGLSLVQPVYLSDSILVLLSSSSTGHDGDRPPSPRPAALVLSPPLDLSSSPLLLPRL